MKFLKIYSLISLFTLQAWGTVLPEGIQPVRTLDGIEEYYIESNGLRILLMPSEGMPVATVMVTYQVGSRNELTGTTGAAHILEHMMFKGTEQFNSNDQSDYSSQMERIGARSNATTWFDRTNYYATMPSKHVPMAIELEADRMRNLLIRDNDLASELTVVRNEYERGENSPVRTLVKELFATAFVAHPYSHPTIGWESDIKSTSVEKLRKFYNTYYWPENAVLTVIGGFDKVETLQAIATHCSVIPKSPYKIPSIDTAEPEQLGPRRLTIERAGQVGVVMVGFKVPEGSHEDWASISLLEQVLGADKTGRLYRALEDKGKASATFTFGPQLHDPGLFIFGAFLTPDSSHKEVESILWKEIEALISAGVDETELQRAKSVIKASTVYGRDGSYAVADQINEAIAMGDWTGYMQHPKAIQEVSAKSIQAVASKYFIKKSSTTGWFVPKVINTLSTLPNSAPGPNYLRDPDVLEIINGGIQANKEISPHSVVNFSSQMRSAMIGNIELITIDMPIDNVVSFVGSIAAGQSANPTGAPMRSSLTAAMLDKGTTNQDRFKVAERLDTLGADIGFIAGDHSLRFSGKFLRADAGSVLELLADQLRNPAFDPDVLETFKSRQEAALLQSIDSPDYRSDAQLSRLLYPSNHINYSTPIDALVADMRNTTVDDLINFHKTHYGSKSMRLVFAGDIDFDQLKAAVGNAFDGWNIGSEYHQSDTAQLDNNVRSERIHLKDKSSVAVRIGYNTGLRRTDDDYLPFMVGNYILGGSFHSRLMSEIRKNQGLTYDIRTRHQGDILTTGNWILAASFSPSILEEGLRATHQVINQWHDQGVTEAEVQSAIATLTGSYLVGLSTTGRVAAQVHSFMQRGLPPEYIDKYPLLIASLTSDKVGSSIDQYFNPNKLTEVIAGSLDKTSESRPILKQKTIPIDVRLDSPDSAWRINIQKIYLIDENIVVISELSRDPHAVASQIISTVTDTIEIDQSHAQCTVQNYIIGKSWDWGDTGEYKFVESIDQIDNLNGAVLLYSKEK